MTEPVLTQVRVEGECLVADDTYYAGVAIEEAIRYARWKGETFDLVIAGNKPLVIRFDSRVEEVQNEWNLHHPSEPYYQ